MSDNNRELLRKDLTNVLRLNEKIDYDNLEEVQKVYNMVIQKNLFKTALGQKYIKRLEQIINKTDQFDQCLLCKNDQDNLSLVCTQCLKKYSYNQAKNTGSPNTKDIGQQISDRSKQTVSTIKGGLDILSTKISETAAEKGIDLKNMPKMENLKDIKKEDVVNMANKSKDTAKKGVKKSVSFWNSLSRKKRIALVIVAFLFIFAIQRNTGNMNQKVSSPTAAHEALAKIFPESEYTITYIKEVTTVSSEMFKMKVGKAIKLGEDTKGFENDNRISYLFSIFDIHNEENSATCWVHENGRIIGTGNLVSDSSGDDILIVRLK